MIFTDSNTSLKDFWGPYLTHIGPYAHANELSFPVSQPMIN